MRAPGDRGEVDIIGPSEGLGASSILAGRTTGYLPVSKPRVASGSSWPNGHESPELLYGHESPEFAVRIRRNMTASPPDRSRCAWRQPVLQSSRVLQIRCSAEPSLAFP